MDKSKDTNSKKTKTQLIVGWVAVTVSLFLACLWALWGILENYHEGWYSTSLREDQLPGLAPSPLVG